MWHKPGFIRWMVIPACLVCGLWEFLALQRARLMNRKLHA
ncbi:MAG: hypothetical protein FD135_3443 [Comamonadaceae bacterium]|nr:MAG: hypothetical protein FD135_3443 [Comamonadaceae bacterium]